MTETRLSIKPTAAFWEVHVFHVVVKDNEIPLGAFTTLDCAARTCVAGGRDYEDSFVVNTVTQVVYTRAECKQFLANRGIVAKVMDWESGYLIGGRN